MAKLKKYYDGAPIPKQLPDSYVSAKGTKKCWNCNYFEKTILGIGYCSAWKASVRNKWVCDSWKAKQNSSDIGIAGGGNNTQVNNTQGY